MSLPNVPRCVCIKHVCIYTHAYMYKHTHGLQRSRLFAIISGRERTLRMGTRRQCSRGQPAAWGRGGVQGRAPRSVPGPGRREGGGRKGLQSRLKWGKESASQKAFLRKPERLTSHREALFLQTPETCQLGLDLGAGGTDGTCYRTVVLGVRLSEERPRPRGREECGRLDPVLRFHGDAS